MRLRARCGDLSVTAEGSFPFTIRRAEGAVVVIFGASHYHADSFAALTAALRQAVEMAAGEGGDAGDIVVDLSGVVLFSSTALRALRTAHMELEARGARIVAAGGGELVGGVLKFAPFIRHFFDVDQALAALKAERDAGRRGET